MIIQSRMQQTRQTAATSAWTDDEADDDPWSGYGDALEMDLTPRATPAAAESQETYVPAARQPVEDEFAAAGARLQQRGQDLHQQQVQRTARRQARNGHYFPHLDQGFNYGGHGLTGRGYAPSQYTPPAPTPVRYTPPPAAPTHHQAPAAPPPAPAPVEEAPPALPYDIDAYGNPILPDGMELDAWGNLVPANTYYTNY